MEGRQRLICQGLVSTNPRVSRNFFWSGLPSGAAESPSRQAAKVESLAELQPAPLYSGQIYHRLQAAITTALLAKVQQPPLRATGAADAADAGAEPGGLPVASAVPEEVKAETTAAVLATSCAAAAPEGGRRSQAKTDRPCVATGITESLAVPSFKDDLPHPRRQCLNRKFESDLESRFRNFLRDAPLQASEAKPFPGSSSNAASPGVALVIGRVVGGKGKLHDIVLPLASEVLMEDGPGHSFLPDLSETQVSKLRAFLDSRVVAHKGKPPNERRWASVSLEQRNAVLRKWRSAATFYCPGSRWHYQLRFREPQTEGAGKDRKEFNLVFQKVPGGQDPTWTVSIVQEAEKIWTEVRMNEAFLFSHRDRMLASQQHCFSRLCRDFRRNAQALQKVLEGIDPHSSGDGGRRLFYPGIFDMASQVQEFYDRRTRGQVDAKGVDATARLRSFNNCIKTLLLESFVDDMDGNLRILDLCCGRGQDLMKYSRQHRTCNVASLVCVDFVAEAVAEARRRYSEMAARGHKAGRPDFAASFYTGDCSSAEVFNELAQDGFSEFDVVVCQFGLHYLLGAEEDATRFLQRIFALLRPGGRFIATVPSCEVLADLYEQATPFTDSGRSRERELQQSLFQVRFEGEAWRHLDTEGGRLSLDEVFQSRWGLPYLFSLKGAVCAEEYLLPWEAFEKLAESTGFSVMADASFPDLLSLLKDKSKFFNDVFSKDRRNESMSCDEEQVFKLYSGFVLERPAEAERNFAGPAKASQYLGGARTPTLAGLRALSCAGRRNVPGGQKLGDAGIGSSIQTMPPVTLPKHMAQPPPLPPVDRLPCRSQLEAPPETSARALIHAPPQRHSGRQKRVSSEPPLTDPRHDSKADLGPDRECGLEGLSRSTKGSCGSCGSAPASCQTSPHHRRATCSEPVGLRNLGNTCFLNAALQSLAHAPLFAQFFLRGRFEADLNPSNPLGTGGEVASAFAQLLHRLVAEGPSAEKSQYAHSAFSPEAFYRTLCKQGA
ncbi:unnamed protein product [Symbiodinium sp. CCMP2456]|nr:unnamed protein product [Symbiodinium sp. CCMP2456]